MKEQALARYQALTSDRQPFLDSGRECALLTLPYLLTEDGLSAGGKLHVPWQSVGAKGCNVLSSKMLMSLFPINTSFFKLQINDAELMELPELDLQMRSEIDLSLSKIERLVMEQIAETSDRVYLHAAMKHLVVTGNVLVFAGKKGLKLYPLDRYVVVRDGNGEVTEILTKESVARQLLPKDFQAPLASLEKDSNAVGEDGPKFGVTSGNKNKTNGIDYADVYTWAKLDNGQWRWHQEADGRPIPGTNSSSPAKFTPWMPLRFNVVDGEDYGRGRVEEFLGDLKSLEGLYQSMVEGSAAAAKVIFTVSPSATTKPQSLVAAQNGSVIQGRPDDVGVINVGKTADFKTVQEMIRDLTQRLSDAFLVLQVRQSERTTASEVQAVQQELNEQLGGIFGNLTTELLKPYLNRKLHLLQRSKKMPPLPKGLVSPTVVAGIYGVGRGQDRQALIEFVQTVAQAMGPEALAHFLNPQEILKRLAAASGIDALNLIKDPATMEQEANQQKQDMMNASLVNQAGQLAKTPAAEQMMAQMMQQNGNPEQAQQALAPTPEAGTNPGGPVQG